MKKVVVLGAGVAGLAAAYRLLKNNFQVTILEKENEIGGLAANYNIEWDGKTYSFAKTYHHILQGDTTLLDLIKELGIWEKFHLGKAKTGFVYKNKVWGLSSPTEFLKFPISFMDKIKLAKFIFYLSMKKNWDDAERVNSKEWISRKAGERNFEIIFDKLIRNKFNKPSEEISAAWFGTRFARESQSFLKKFGWFEGGGEPRVLNLLAEKIKEMGGIIKTGVIVKKIYEDSTVEYQEDGKTKKEKPDLILSTISTETFLGIANPSENLKKKFREIKYLGAICICVGFKKKLSKFYWLNVLDNLPFKVIFSYDNLAKDVAPPGKSVVYLASYMSSEDPRLKKGDEDMFNEWMKKLELVFPGCSKEYEWFKVVKFKFAEAIFDTKFENPPIKDGKFYFAGIYRIFPKVRDVSVSLESGFETAEEILRDFHE
jgi:protoporphyrinogen oxidase